MQTRNKFFRGFSASKVIVLILVVALFVATFFLPDKVGVNSAYLLTIFVCLEFLTVGATSIFYGIQMVKYGVGKDSKQPFLAIGVLSLVFAVGYISLSFFIRSSGFEAIRFVFRLAPLVFAASICFVVPLRISEYKEYKQKSNYLKSVDDNTYYDRFMNSNSLEEEQTIIKEAEEYVIIRMK